MKVENQKFWRAIRVNSRAEKKIGMSLKGKGITAYVPLVKTLKFWSDRKKMVEQPLLNGYVFVNSNDLENDVIVQVDGVVNFIKFEGKIAIIREIEIERIKQLELFGYNIDATITKQTYKHGDKISIAEGSLKGINGIVLENKEGKFVEILLESIGQTFKVKLSENLIKAVK